MKSLTFGLLVHKKKNFKCISLYKPMLNETVVGQFLGGFYFYVQTMPQGYCTSNIRIFVHEKIF